MPYHSAEESLGNLINTPPENFSEEMISANETNALTPKQTTSTMEVHHHPGLHHKYKKWKE